MLADEAIEQCDHVLRRDVARDENRQALARAVVDNWKDLELPAVFQSVEQEVVTPDVILAVGDGTLLPCAASSAPLACSDCDLESFIAALSR